MKPLFSEHNVMHIVMGLGGMWFAYECIRDGYKAIKGKQSAPELRAMGRLIAGLGVPGDSYTTAKRLFRIGITTILGGTALGSFGLALLSNMELFAWIGAGLMGLFIVDCCFSSIFASPDEAGELDRWLFGYKVGDSKQRVLLIKLQDLFFCVLLLGGLFWAGIAVVKFPLLNERIVWVGWFILTALFSIPSFLFIKFPEGLGRIFPEGLGRIFPEGLGWILEKVWHVGLGWLIASMVFGTMQWYNGATDKTSETREFRWIRAHASREEDPSFFVTVALTEKPLRTSTVRISRDTYNSLGDRRKPIYITIGKGALGVEWVRTKGRIGAGYTAHVQLTGVEK